ncbi:MAG: ABC transporter permease [Mangrovibacterium sp.]
MKIFRRLKATWQWFTVNLLGLTVALTALLLISAYTWSELSYDRFHSKADRIYRITINSNNGATSIHPARLSGNIATEIQQEYPAVESLVRLVPFKKAIVRIGEHQFYTEQAFSTDSTFFHVFDFKVLVGNPATAFRQPNRAYICESLALKYFSSTDVIGREITVFHQQSSEPNVYTIEGVMADFQANSHFHAQLLTSFTELEDRTTWAYTYLLMKPGADVQALKESIQQKWDSEKEADRPSPILYFTKLTDIHLYSHLTREMEKNGDILSLILLGTGAIIVLFIALINYFNLSRVQFIAGMKILRVKLINGASKRILARELAAEALLLAGISVVLGILLSWFIGREFFGFEPLLLPGKMAAIVTPFVFVIVLIALLPLLNMNLELNTKLDGRSGKLYKLPLVLQFTLAVLAISCTLVLKRQMNFLNKQHPESENANMVVMSNNPWEVVQRYDLLKTQLEKEPSITNMTAAMEEPGGDILDNVWVEMEGIQKDEELMLGILTTDSNFFVSMGVKPLAGTLDLRPTPGLQWEANATELSIQRQSTNPNTALIAELEQKVGHYREQYILNVSALKQLGIVKPEDAIGKRFHLKFNLPDLFPEGEVVGVVPDFHYTNLHSQEKPLVIVSRKMFNYGFLINIDPRQRTKALAAIASAWQTVNPEFPMDYEYITDSYRNVYAQEYAQANVLSLFALLAVMLSALGILSLSAFKLQRSVKEIGIRKVNGAKVSEILAMLNRDFIKWVVIAFVIATPIAYYAMSKWLENFAYKTTLSWWIFALAGLLALAIALLTVSWQSWRAATRNPVEALRYE